MISLAIGTVIALGAVLFVVSPLVSAKGSETARPVDEGGADSPGSP